MSLPCHCQWGPGSQWPYCHLATSSISIFKFGGNNISKILGRFWERVWNRIIWLTPLCRAMCGCCDVRALLCCVIFSRVMSFVIRGPTSVLIPQPSAGGGLDQTDNPENSDDEICIYFLPGAVFVGKSNIWHKHSLLRLLCVMLIPKFRFTIENSPWPHIWIFSLCGSNSFSWLLRFFTIYIFFSFSSKNI